MKGLERKVKEISSRTKRQRCKMRTNWEHMKFNTLVAGLFAKYNIKQNRNSHLLQPKDLNDIHSISFVTVPIYI